MFSGNTTGRVRGKYSIKQKYNDIVRKEVLKDITDIIGE